MDKTQKQKHAEYLLSPAWETVRQIVIERDKRCRNCGRIWFPEPITGLDDGPKYFDVHHTSYVLFGVGADGLPDMEALTCELLCRICHSKEHGGNVDAYDFRNIEDYLCEF